MRTRNLKSFLLAASLAAALVVGLAKPSQALFDKTRFAAHLGVAYFCFHHWVSNPYREGKFTAGTPHRTASLVKAGAALLFAVHEVKVSNKIAHNSKDPLLQKLAGSLDNMQSSFASVGDRFKHGNFKKEDLDTLNGSYGSVDSDTKAAKINVKDVPVAIPGG